MNAPRLASDVDFTVSRSGEVMAMKHDPLADDAPAGAAMAAERDEPEAGDEEPKLPPPIDGDEDDPDQTF